mmetsp:Transcript_38174/g.94861  ORF Transcript_38174/g.94861 Transcript_38174/m.94861 type:complete len:223 (-) Transcript_38174:2230-2898(-)
MHRGLITSWPWSSTEGAPPLRHTAVNSLTKSSMAPPEHASARAAAPSGPAHRFTIRLEVSKVPVGGDTGALARSTAFSAARVATRHSRVEYRRIGASSVSSSTFMLAALSAARPASSAAAAASAASFTAVDSADTTKSLRRMSSTGNTSICSMAAAFGLSRARCAQHRAAAALTLPPSSAVAASRSTTAVTAPCAAKHLRARAACLCCVLAAISRSAASATL